MSDRVSLGEVTEIVTGYPFKSLQFTANPADIRLLRGDNIGQGHLRWEGVKRWPSNDLQSFETYQVREGDVVLAMDRPWIQAGLKFARVRLEDMPSLLVQRVALLRAKPPLSQRFLTYLVGSPDFTSYLLSVQTGTSVPHISSQQIASFKFSLPASERQEEIATLLEALDDKIVVNHRIVAASAKLAQTIFETSVLEAQASPEIAEVAMVLDGPHATPTKTTKGPWFLSISSLKAGILDLDESARMTEDEFPRWTRRVRPQEGDVLFSYETRLGDAALMLPGIRASLGRRMAVLRSKSPEISGALLLHSYLSPTFNRQIRERATQGATVDRISLTEMPSWKLPLPAQENRKRYSDVLEKIHRRIAASLLEKRSLIELRNALLPELMSGRLRVKDAEKVVEEAV
ncbi:restriction endonuclease subunit S [Solwaraspora sp. WMMA2101]|uniref:restriction endonuclease subunit S n=1 Tax=Solwaraspora sp. WMMA2101 TaxID=3404124 RepID=UPI003B932459